MLVGYIEVIGKDVFSNENVDFDFRIKIQLFKLLREWFVNVVI